MDRNARRREIKALDHEQFELLVHEVLVADRGSGETTLRKLSPPDGGADSLVLRRGESVEGVFQAKHSPDTAPNWSRWEASLDDAVAHWRPSWVTFVVSRAGEGGMTEPKEPTTDVQFSGLLAVWW